ncbi:TMEM165/GDT1 family protein [Phormidium tenue FACHB-886]|nr:TMEM165/GDT1 family protein [Phormidium tenue FACHB-886]
MDSSPRSSVLISPISSPDALSVESDSILVELQAESVQPIASTRPDWRTELKIFCSTFLTIFLAELGDKTQMTTLLLSAQSHAPWVVFLGAGSALVLTSLLGVWVGCWLSKRVAPRTLETGAGVMLLLIATLLIWDVIQG